MTRRKKKIDGPTDSLGRRTVDYFELAPRLEEARKELGFRSFAEFARQIARDYLENKNLNR